ncbi:VOC family protein [Pedobacter sp. SD-b]|uniref:VOC family protein n=1 Tax=Pedobacter segetis TaxID=2793069 RepID=A0ABS1BJH6_9SPHI|nr:VOC family protein [Pedobacter segetis]MBK0383053.1 VOC family protein [Pedobacter segetis]
MKKYKPDNYNALSPYLIVDDAQKLVSQLKTIFDCVELRRMDRENGKIAHLELKFEDSVLMVSDSLEGYPAYKTMLHIYVADVFETFDKAIRNGCKAIEKPVNKKGDPDTRGAFYDLAGNYWAIGTQTHPS